MALEVLTMSDANMFDVLIVGAGPAGLTAAMYAARANVKVGFIECEVPGGKIVNIANIKNYPGFKSVNGADLALSMYEQATESGAIYLYGRVTGMTQKSGYQVVFLETGVNYFAKALIIATGTIENKLNIKGENEFLNKGVSYCVTCDGPLAKEKVATIIGDDISETITLLSSVAKNINAITTNQSLLSLPYKNVKFYLDAKCNEIKGNDHVTTISIVDKNNHISEIPTDFVFINNGYKASLDFLNDEVLTSNKKIIETNDEKATTTKGIFAIGDITRINNRQIVTAVSDGATAAINAVKFAKTIFK